MSSHYRNLNVGILFQDFGPYHKTRIEAFAIRLLSEGAHLYALRMYASSEEYSWIQCNPNTASVISLSSRSKSNTNPLNLCYRLLKSLLRYKIKAVFLPSYSPLANLLCFLVAKSCGCKTILMTESWQGCESKSKVKTILKKIVIPLFDSALVGGAAQRAYLKGYKFNPVKIFDGYNVVDNDYFEFQSQLDSSLSDSPIFSSLPQSYFLNLGRFVPKKNLFTLIEAYSLALSMLNQNGKSRYPNPNFLSNAPALVLVGEGELLSDLIYRAFMLGINIRNGAINTNPSQGPEIVFFPFQQIDNIPMIMSRCLAFILPSLWEEWGLVVNEAMSCKVPVIVSSNVGCTFELIQDEVSGLLFDPNDTYKLAQLLVRCFLDSHLRRKLANNAFIESRKWRPIRFANGAFSALDAAFQKV